MCTVPASTIMALSGLFVIDRVLVPTQTPNSLVNPELGMMYRIVPSTCKTDFLEVELRSHELSSEIGLGRLGRTMRGRSECCMRLIWDVGMGGVGGGGLKRGWRTPPPQGQPLQQDYVESLTQSLAQVEFRRASLALLSCLGRIELILNL